MQTVKSSSTEPRPITDFNSNVIETKFGKRVTGLMDLSVGTQLGFETLFGQDTILFDEKREIKAVDPNEYQHHVINIFTLIRNIVSSFEDTSKMEEIYTSGIVEEILLREFEMIKSHYRKYDRVKVYTYYPNYLPIVRNMNRNKGDAFTKTYYYYTLASNILKSMSKKGEVGNMRGDFKISRLDGNVLVFTHMPTDLLSPGNISLLESHTGTIKTRSQFYTKFHKVGQNDLSHIPFWEDTVFFLGENHLVIPATLGIRRKLLECASFCKWTAQTTREKVRSDIRKYKELNEVIFGYNKMF